MQEFDRRHAPIERLHRWPLFQHAEDLHLRNVARRRRRETADLIALLPERADGVPLARLVSLEIVQTDAAWVGRVSVHLQDQRAGVSAGVERIAAAFGDVLEQRGEGRIEQAMADRHWLAIVLVVERRGARVLAQGRIADQQAMQAWADFETVFSKFDSWLEQSFPRQLAVLVVRALKHPHHAWHTH